MPSNASKIKISVITPTFNRKHCVMDTVTSVLKQNTDFFDYEVIVSDDGSTDGTSALFKKTNKKIIYFWHKNVGVNGARNLAIKRAKGDLILLLDSDDRLADDAFNKIKKEYKNLSEINFFGTINKRTEKKMYKIRTTGKYNYKDWLEGDKIRGEFLSLMKREVFAKDLFDEKRFCFESFFWNKVIKKYGVSAFDDPLRLYSFEQENRVSKQLMNPEKAAKRYDDYVEYLRRFEKDYDQYNLKKQLGNILFTTGFYAMVAGDKKEARKYFRQSIRTRTSLKNLLAYALSFLGKGRWYAHILLAAS